MSRIFQKEIKKECECDFFQGFLLLIFKEFFYNNLFKKNVMSYNIV